MTLDDIRARYPHLGLALYAMDPGGPVTLEAFMPDGGTASWVGRSEAAVLAVAFGIDNEEPEPAPPAPAVTESVFD